MKKIIKNLCLLASISLLQNCSHSAKETSLDNQSHSNQELGVDRKIASSDAEPCGLTGSIDQRINDCYRVTGETYKEFSVVSRTKQNYYIFLEKSTGLIWSHALGDGAKTYNWYDAMASCKTSQPEFSTLDTINGSWRLPSKSVYEYSNRVGEQRITFPHQDWSYWTSTPLKNNPDRAFFYNPAIVNSTGHFGIPTKSSKTRARCVYENFCPKVKASGDINKDGKITSSDILALRRDYILKNKYWRAYDYNNDDVIDAEDIEILKSTILGTNQCLVTSGQAKKGIPNSTNQ